MHPRDDHPHLITRTAAVNNPRPARGGPMIARRDPAAPRPDLDTTADDCAMDFLGDLDESLWILTDVQRSPANHFTQATRKRDHVNELRRTLYRLHQVLLEWEDAN